MAELLELITTPIPGESPMGENVNYDGDFDALKSEMGKLGGIDLDLVQEKATTILKEKSKDIRVMCFLAYAVLREEKWGHLADIFEGMTKLASEQWDAVHPQRVRAKQLGLKWLSEDRFSDLAKEKKPAEGDYEDVNRLVESLTALRPILDEKFPDGAPFPSTLFKNAQAWEKSTKPKPQEQPSEAPSSQSAASGGASGPAQSGGAPAAQAPSGSGGPEPMDTPKQAQTIARRPARFLQEKEPQKIMGFRLMRSLRWDIFGNLPPAQDGKTQLPAPNPQQRSFFENTLNQGDWKTLHEKAEEVFCGGSNHLWLDLQRYSATACKEMGKLYEPIQNMIIFELGFLLKRLPGLENLSFSDGSGFCDGVTSTWITEEVLPAFSGDGESSGGSGGGGSDPLEDERKEINGLVAGGNIQQALAVAQNGIRNSASEEDNFRRSILLGQVLMKAKQPDIALSIFESLDEKVGTYQLDKWNPDLATEAWSGLIQAIKVARASKPQNVQVVLTEKHNTILKRISQVNPMKAFELSK